MVDGVNGQDHKGMKAALDSLNAVRSGIRKEEQTQQLIQKINGITEKINALQPKLREAIANNNTKYIQEIGEEIQTLKTLQDSLINKLPSLPQAEPQDSTAKAKGPSVFGDGFAGQE